MRYCLSVWSGTTDPFSWPQALNEPLFQPTVRVGYMIGIGMPESFIFHKECRGFFSAGVLTCHCPCIIYLINFSFISLKFFVKFTERKHFILFFFSPLLFRSPFFFTYRIYLLFLPSFENFIFMMIRYMIVVLTVLKNFEKSKSMDFFFFFFYLIFLKSLRNFYFLSYRFALILLRGHKKFIQ